MNQDIIYKLVKDHFGLRNDSLKYFKKELFNPTIDAKYKEILSDSKDLRKRWKIKEEDLKMMDRGWLSFIKFFSSFVKEKGVTYENFRTNKIKTGKNEAKLFKTLITYYKNRISIAHRDTCPNCDGNCTYSSRSIENCIQSKVEEIGNLKLPNRPLEIVLSLNFADWFLCSTGQSWKSCLNLESSYCYWAGLPGLIGDKNRSMIYMTDGRTKNYYGIEVDSIKNRSWVLLNRNDDLFKVNWYGNAPLDLSMINKITGLKIKQLDASNFYKSKNKINFLFHENDVSCFIYQDVSRFDIITGYIYSGCSSNEWFYDGKTQVQESDYIFNYKNGLKNLIDNNDKITNHDNMTIVCYACEDNFDEEECYYFNDRPYCEDCYNENITCCSGCDEMHYSNDSHYVEGLGMFYCEDCYNEFIDICDCCKKDFLKDKLYYFNDRPYCEECYMNNFTHCCECEDVFAYDDLITVADGSQYCSECVEEHCKKCFRCEEFFVTEDMVKFKYEYYCSKCIKDVTNICCNCGKPEINEGDFLYISSSSEYLCKSCHNKNYEKFQPYLFQDMEKERKERLCIV